MKKAYILIAVCLCLLATLAAFTGCGTKPRTVITIRYAAWNLGDLKQNGLERQMIMAFMEEYPNIKIAIDEDFTKDYDKAFQSAAQSNNLPDVFMYASNPMADSKGWCADITNLVAQDREWENIPTPLRESAQVKGRTIAVPCSMHLYGYFCNDELLDKMHIEHIQPGFTIQRFRKVIEKATAIEDHSIGLADESSIVEWYPAAVNRQMQWFSWDGGKLNLNSPEFKSGVELARSIFQKRQTFAALSESEKQNFGFSSDWEAWRAGSMALRFDGTWMVDDYAKLPYKLSFLGIPGGRACIVPDYMFINKDCQHPEEAYQFIKFMSTYSRQGFNKRLDLAKSNHQVVSSIPMTKDKRLIEKYFSTVKIGGIKEVYNSLNQNSYVEGTKVLPGYIEARWNHTTNIKVGTTNNARIGDVITSTYRGPIDIEIVADDLNSCANESLLMFPRTLYN